jgi:putative transposase
MDPIGRKRLPHEIPAEVSLSLEEEVFFITICCLSRGENQLADDRVWEIMDETLRHREALGEIKVRLVLAMPDHLHGLFSFPGTTPMQRVISSFKEWIAKQCGIRWQRDFFDHRLRSWESGAEKARYIRENPVRAGLVERSEDWPYQR